MCKYTYTQNAFSPIDWVSHLWVNCIILHLSILQYPLNHDTSIPWTLCTFRKQVLINNLAYYRLTFGEGWGVHTRHIIINTSNYTSTLKQCFFLSLENSIDSEEVILLVIKLNSVYINSCIFHCFKRLNKKCVHRKRDLTCSPCK